MIVTAPAQITQVTTLADGSIKFVAVTPELEPKDMAILFALRRQSGYWAFSQAPIQQQDVPAKPVKVQGESPSQRLRANLYRYWEQQGAQGDFEQFYRQQMERFITLVREKME